MTARPDAPAARRNRDAILEVLQVELADCDRVLEIGSGTGQHAVWFAEHLPQLTWQTSDRITNHPGIQSWIDADGKGNTLSPLELDVDKAVPTPETYDAVFSANTAHIMGYPTVERMFQYVAATLVADGLFCLYGPFNVDGEFTSDSNERFDESLRMQNPEMGIRDLGALTRLANGLGLTFHRQYAMPANNMLVIWLKNG